MPSAFSKSKVWGSHAGRKLDQFTQRELSPGIDVTFSRPSKMPAFTPAALCPAMATAGTMLYKCRLTVMHPWTSVLMRTATDFNLFPKKSARNPPKTNKGNVKKIPTALSHFTIIVTIMCMCLQSSLCYLQRSVNWHRNDKMQLFRSSRYRGTIWLTEKKSHV